MDLFKKTMEDICQSKLKHIKRFKNIYYVVQLARYLPNIQTDDQVCLSFNYMVNAVRNDLANHTEKWKAANEVQWLNNKLITDFIHHIHKIPLRQLKPHT